MLIEEMPRINEKELLRQLKLLGRNINHRVLIDHAQRGIIPPPEGRGGRGKKKTYAPQTAGEIHANIKLVEIGNLNISQQRTTREVALMIENAPNLTQENYTAETTRISNAFKDKEFFLYPVCVWLVEKWGTLMRIYGQRLELTPRVHKFFDPDYLKMLVWQFHTGWFAGYTMNAEGKLIEVTTDHPTPPRVQDVIAAWANNASESSAAPMVAKGRS